MVCRHQCFKFDASHYRQPVEVSELGGDVRVSGDIEYQMSCAVLDSL